MVGADASEGKSAGAPGAHVLKTGIDGLDHILGGGLPAQTVVLIQGEAGAGKTTAALQFLLEGVAQGETGLLVSAAQTREELELIARSHGMDLSPLNIVTLGIGEKEDEPEQEQYSVSTNETDLSDLLAETYRLVDEAKPVRFVFDSLLELRLLSPNDVHYRREILKLKRYLVGRRICAMVLDHFDIARVDRQIEGVAHGVIALDSITPRIGRTQRNIQVRKFRGRSFLEGVHDYRIVRGGLKVFPRIVPHDLPPRELGEPLPTGQEGFDQMLGGGLEFGSTTLISGQSGTGKSTLSTLFACAAAEQGAKAALFLFEERPEVHRARSDAVGLPVSRLEAQDRLFLHHFDPAEISAGEFSQVILSKVDSDDLGVVVIDSFSGYIHALGDPQDVVTQLHSLVQYLARRGILVIVIMAQQGLMGEPPETNIDIAFVADSVLQLSHHPVNGEIQRVVAVLKKRHSEHERQIRRFVIASGAVTVTETG